LWTVAPGTILRTNSVADGGTTRSSIPCKENWWEFSASGWYQPNGDVNINTLQLCTIPFELQLNCIAKASLCCYNYYSLRSLKDILAFCRFTHFDPYLDYL
jgi:hypothetical protein